MYCKRCGTKLEDGIVFCPSCGERKSETEIASNSIHTSSPPHNNLAKKQGMIKKTIIVAVAVVAIIVLVKGILYFDHGYERAIEKYAEAITKESGEKLCGVYPSYYIDYMVGDDSWYRSRRGIVADYNQECEYMHKVLMKGAGGKEKVKFEVKYERKITKKNLERLNRALENEYDYAHNVVGKAYYIKFKTYIPGGDRCYNTEAYFLRINGKWYMSRGDLSGKYY